MFAQFCSYVPHFCCPTEEELEEVQATLALSHRDDLSSHSGSVHQELEFNSSDESEKFAADQAGG